MKFAKREYGYLQKILTFSVSFCSEISAVTSPPSLVEISEASSQVTVGIVIGLGWASMVAICLSLSRGDVLLFRSSEPPAGAPSRPFFTSADGAFEKLVTASWGARRGGFRIPRRARAFAAKYIRM